tara:strand:+ start:2141 stop:2683 length:543 start_codon:yes stop_codon:yes gene_type:complete
MAYYGAEAAVEAMDEFLQDATYGFNAQLSTMRSDLSLSTSDLPNVAEYSKYYPKATQARSFPSMGVIYLSDTAEQEANSRMINLSLETRLTVLDLNVNGSESEVGLAMCRYRDALTKIFIRRLPMGRQGWTLSNGGTSATGRVIRCTIERHSLEFDPEIQASTPNMMLRTEYLVRLQEDY